MSLWLHAYRYHGGAVNKGIREVLIRTGKKNKCRKSWILVGFYGDFSQDWMFKIVFKVGYRLDRWLGRGFVEGL